jgi:hypothetical protein
MDKKLLDSLNNLSLALEDIAAALKDKGEANSATAKALKGGDFIKEIKEINVGVKQLQKDTKQILANQQTIMGMAKSKSDKKENVAEGLGKDKTAQKNFKEGLGVILLMAVAVLALGVAFNLIGKVNFFSVIALSIALPLLAIGFAKVHKTLKEVGFDPKKDSVGFIIAIVAIATGVTLSSWILSMVSPLSFTKFFTVVFIGGTFALLAPSIAKFMLAFKDMSWGQLIKSVVAFPLILPAIALSMALSSWAFQLIKPIGLSQFLTAVGIGIVFAIVSFGIRKMLKAFDKLDIKDLSKAVIFLPIILPAIALGLALSSYAFQLIKPISLVQFITALAISAVFAIISFALKPIAAGMKQFDWKDVPKIPVFFTLLALSIMLSSHILSNTKTIPGGKLWSILLFGIVFAAVALALSPTIRILSKIGLKELLIGGLAIVVVATAIMISSHILALGNYKKFPDWKWALGVGMSMILFTPAVLALGIIAMSGVGALAILAGAGMVLVIAGTIVATSHILAAGNYANYPPLSWSGSVALSMGAFALGMTVLGGLILATFGVGAAMLAAGSGAVLMVADTIVQTSYVLAKGKYTGGPTKDWAEGIAISLGAFMPVYRMLMANSILSIFGGGGVGPDDFAKAIRTVSQGIVDAAVFFANNKVAFKAGPPKAWAEGVGTAIGAFAPVYKVLADNSGWMASGVSVEDMAKAIMTISRGIVDAAKFFAKNKSPFTEGNYPSKKWGEGVGAALGAFAPVFKALNEDTGWFTSGDEVINNMKNAIMAISSSLVSSARMFAGAKNVWGAYPTKQWADGVKLSIMSFLDLFGKIEDSGFSIISFTLYTKILNNALYSIAASAKTLWVNQKFFSFKMNTTYIADLSKNVLGYAKLARDLDKALTVEEKKTISLGFLGEISYTSKKNTEVSNVNKVVSQMVITAGILYRNRRFFEQKIDPNFMGRVAKNILTFADLANQLSQKQKGQSKFDEMMGWDPISRAANGMVKIASAYDTLAKSIKNFSAAINSLNVVKLQQFRMLTGNLAMLSAMDSGMFSNMLKVLETRTGVFANLLKVQSQEMLANRPTVKSPTAMGGDKKQVAAPLAKDSKGETQLQKLDKVIYLLKKLEMNSTDINTFLQTKTVTKREIGEGDG